MVLVEREREMTQLLAFHNTEVSKSRLLATLAGNRNAERLTQAHDYWRTGRGCAVGCAIHAFRPGQEGEHLLFEELFGIPETLAHLQDAIFERMTTEQAVAFPERFVDAITVGADLRDVAMCWGLWLMRDPDSPTAQWHQSLPQLSHVAEMMERQLGDHPPTTSEWESLTDRLQEEQERVRQPVKLGEDLPTREWEDFVDARQAQTPLLVLEAAEMVARMLVEPDEEERIMLPSFAAQSASLAYEWARLDRNVRGRSSAPLEHAYDLMADALCRLLQEAPVPGGEDR